MTDPRGVRQAPGPADRYGTRRRTDRRLLVAGVAVAVLAAVGFLGWVAWHQGRQVSWQEVSFDPSDPARPALTFQVTRPAGSAVTCTITALNHRHAVVGRRDVAVPAGADRTVQLSSTLRTAEPAVAVQVDRCAVTG